MKNFNFHPFLSTFLAYLTFVIQIIFLSLDVKKIPINLSSTAYFSLLFSLLLGTNRRWDENFIRTLFLCCFFLFMYIKVFLESNEVEKNFHLHKHCVIASRINIFFASFRFRGKLRICSKFYIYLIYRIKLEEVVVEIFVSIPVSIISLFPCCLCYREQQ